MATIPSPEWREPLAFTASRSAPARRSEAAYGGAGHLLWIMVPLVHSLVCWSLWGDRLVDARAQQLVEVAGIVLIGCAGLLLVLYARIRNVRRERAYSAHLEELSTRLQNLAYHDSLTGLYNHRYFYEQLSHEVERAGRYGRPVSVILLDLDRFKEINDTYGHLMGDRLLALMGQIVRDQVRGADVAARYGGDEFGIILPDTPRAAAEATALKLERAVASGGAESDGLGGSVQLGASFGVACCPDEARSVSELLHAADARLYANKKADRPASVESAIG